MELRESLLAVNQRLLDAVSAKDWETYESLCEPGLTCFEPEACGQLVQGLAFHRFYFQGPAVGRGAHETVCAPTVRLLSETVGVVTYTRLVQVETSSGEFQSRLFEETRVWSKASGEWRLAHFHRSVPQAAWRAGSQPSTADIL